MDASWRAASAQDTGGRVVRPSRTFVSGAWWERNSVWRGPGESVEPIGTLGITYRPMPWCWTHRCC